MHGYDNIGMTQYNMVEADRKYRIYYGCGKILMAVNNMGVAR